MREPHRSKICFVKIVLASKQLFITNSPPPETPVPRLPFISELYVTGTKCFGQNSFAVPPQWPK